VPRLAAEWERVHGAAPTRADVDRVYAVFLPMNEELAFAAQGYAPVDLVCADDLSEGRPGSLGMYQCFVDLQIYPPAAVLKVDDTPPGIAEGGGGLSLSGNIVGRTPEELAALLPAEVDAIRAEAMAILTAAGAAHLMDTVADLTALMEWEFS